MSSEERKQILQMVADGKISAEEAAQLMRALEDSAEEVEIFQPETNDWNETSADDSSWGEKPDAPEFDAVRKRAMRFALIPLWVGIIVTVLSAWWMFSVQQNSGLNFWFFCLTIPFLFGVLLTALGAGGQTARWLYVNVDRSNQKDGPRHITIGFPIPLGLIAWFLKNFGGHIEGLKQTALDEILMGLSAAKDVTEPLIINVDESDKGGERVQVFIG